MLFWLVKEVKETTTIIYNTLTQETKELDYDELTKFNQDIYMRDKVDITGLRCFHRYNEKTGKEHSIIVQILPADKINTIDKIYPNIVNVPNLPCLLLCIGNDYNLGDYYSVPKSTSTTYLTEIKFKTEYKPKPVMHLLNFVTTNEKINNISMENIQHIGKLGIFDFFPYYPISFIKKNGSNSLIYCVDSFLKFSTKTLSEIYLDLQNYINNKFQICTDLYRAECPHFMEMALKSINFSPVWMVDKTHIALKMSNTITVIDISDFLNKPQLTDKQKKAAYLRERMVTKGILLKRTVVEDGHLKVGFLELTKEESEKYNTSDFIKDKYFSLNPSIKYLDSGSIFPSNASTFDTIPLMISNNLEAIHPNFLAKRSGAGKLLYVTWSYTMTFEQLIRLCCRHIPVIYNIRNVLPCGSYTIRYEITDKNCSAYFSTITKMGEIYARAKYLSNMKCYIGTETLRNKTFIDKYTVESKEHEFIYYFLEYLINTKTSIEELNKLINKNYKKLNLDEIQNVIGQIKLGLYTRKDANKEISKVLHLPTSINYVDLFSHLNIDNISNIALLMLAPDMFYKCFPIYIYIEQLRVHGLIQNLPSSYKMIFDELKMEKQQLQETYQSTNIKNMCSILSNIVDAYSFFINFLSKI